MDAGHHGGSYSCRDDLRDGEVKVDVGLEVNLLHRDAVEGLRLHVLDAGHVGADRVLTIGRDPLLHLRHAQAGVLPDYRHHRNVDLREDVLRHDHDRGDAEKQNEGSQNVERVRKFQRKPNDTHLDILLLAHRTCLPLLLKRMRGAARG